MWLPLYVALHPVRIHPGLLKCHVNPLGNRTCERVEFLVLSFLQFIDKQFSNVPLHVLCTFFLYFNIIKDQLMEATPLAAGCIADRESSVALGSRSTQ